MAASRLWDQKGLWRAGSIAHLYRWRWPIRVLVRAAGGTGRSPGQPAGISRIGHCRVSPGAPVWHGWTRERCERDAPLSRLLAGRVRPGALPTWLPRLIAFIVIAGLLTLFGGSFMAWRRAPLCGGARAGRSRGRFWARRSRAGAAGHFTTGLWDLLRGGAHAEGAACRRFEPALFGVADRKSWPARLQRVAAGGARSRCAHAIWCSASSASRIAARCFRLRVGRSARRAEAFDLAGLARDHLVDVIRAAVSVPGLTEPALARFAPDSFWRGEVHRLIDRPASLARLLEEAAAAGAEQLILVSASPEPPGPHELARPRLDPLGRISEHASSMEAAAVRDAVRHVQHRFRAVYPIRPSLQSGRRIRSRTAPTTTAPIDVIPLSELMERGYEDAYRDFIEPVVAASGETRATAPKRASKLQVQGSKVTGFQRSIDDGVTRFERRHLEPRELWNLER